MSNYTRKVLKNDWQKCKPYYASGLDQEESCTNKDLETINVAEESLKITFAKSNCFSIDSIYIAYGYSTEKLVYGTAFVSIFKKLFYLTRTSVDAFNEVVTSASRRLRMAISNAGFSLTQSLIEAAYIEAIEAYLKEYKKHKKIKVRMAVKFNLLNQKGFIRKNVNESAMTFVTDELTKEDVIDICKTAGYIEGIDGYFGCNHYKHDDVIFSKCICVDVYDVYDANNAVYEYEYDNFNIFNQSGDPVKMLKALIKSNPVLDEYVPDTHAKFSVVVPDKNCMPKLMPGHHSFKEAALIADGLLNLTDVINAVVLPTREAQALVINNVGIEATEFIEYPNEIVSLYLMQND